MIGKGVTAAVVPFAQREMVNRFMEGVDPKSTEAVERICLALLGQGYPNKIAEALDGKISPELQESMRKELIELGTSFHRTLPNALEDFRQSPVHRSGHQQRSLTSKRRPGGHGRVAWNLTAFKRRMTSVETDTVALPIDVAVISKGDGFIWIKRKHYFQPALNQHFFSNYYRKDEASHHGEPRP